jgi:copper chaperone NosL
VKRWLEITLLGLSAMLIGCSSGPETGPGEVRWDKEACTRCLMSVSDRHYSAQVRGGQAGGRTRLYFFDDLGCAVLWLEKQPWREDPRTEIWVTDQASGKWLDARAASYETGRITPMDYGLGAVTVPGVGALDFDEAVAQVHSRENSQHRRPGETGTTSKGTDQQ